MNGAYLWTSQCTRKFLGFLFQIRLRAVRQGCRNLLRTPARESGAGREPRIRTVRQLAAAAGDGWLGSVGSPGQLETSLNSGYTVGPCNSYLEGPTPISLGLLLAQFSWACCPFGLAARASRAGIRRRRHSSRTKSAFAHRSSDRRARDLPTLAAFLWACCSRIARWTSA